MNGRSGPILLTNRQIVCGDISRDTRLVSERHPAPNPAGVPRAILPDQTRPIWQSDDDVVVQAGPFAELQQIVRPGALHNGTGTDGASGSDQYSEKGREVGSHFGACIRFALSTTRAGRMTAGGRMEQGCGGEALQAAQHRFSAPMLSRRGNAESPAF